jgi:membrane associated rhomboid family serine protease
MLSSTEGWAVGYKGTILRWNGATWAAVESPLLAYLKNKYGISSDLMEVRMLSPTEGWAVGKKGVTLRWDGWAWLGMAYPLLGEVDSVYMLSPTEGWATFNDGLMRWGQTQEKGFPNELFILFWVFVLVLLVRDIISKRGSKNNLGIPPITFGLIVANIVIFKLVGSSIFAVSDYGLRPGAILQMRNFHSILTSMFMHADYSHLVGNLFFLPLFGQIVERGHRGLRFLMLYLLAGIVASFLDIYVEPSSLIPAIGSSGAIAGVLGACAVGFPDARESLFIVSLLILPIFALFLPSYCMSAVLLFILALALQFPGKRLPVFPFLFTWAFYQLGMGVTLLAGRASQIGYWAHVGGFVGGMFLYHLLKKREAREVKEPGIPPIG